MYCMYVLYVLYVLLFMNELYLLIYMCIEMYSFHALHVYGCIVAFIRHFGWFFCTELERAENCAGV